MTATESKLREALKTRSLDYKTTAEIARAIGCAPATALRTLHLLLAEGFTAEDGATLCQSETDAGKHQGSRNDSAPVKYIWFFC